MRELEQLLRRAYDAFNRRDIEVALALMHHDVDWPNAMEGGREHGHEAVRGYWTRQFGLIDSHVEPQRFDTDEKNRVVVDVLQIVRSTSGDVLSDRHVQHIYTLRDGLIVRMDVADTQPSLDGSLS
ncbi:MAG: nuclear transport factor 2 family protein [Actinobacteria bacterium]|nr:nuclear transport factor 2 family protein [Actinomycetota bacterium]